MIEEYGEILTTHSSSTHHCFRKIFKQTQESSSHSGLRSPLVPTRMRTCLGVRAVKTIFIIILRIYLPFSYSFLHINNRIFQRLHDMWYHYRLNKEADMRTYLSVIWPNIEICKIIKQRHYSHKFSSEKYSYFSFKKQTIYVTM